MSSLVSWLKSCDSSNFEHFVSELYVVRQGRKIALRAMGFADSISLEMVKDKFKALGIYSQRVVQRLQEFARRQRGAERGVSESSTPNRAFTRQRLNVEECSQHITKETIDNSTSQFAPRIVAELQSRANNGDVEAMYLYGYALLKGKGVYKNLREAAIWFKMAADKGHVYALWAYGDCYNGKGVIVDYDLANECYARCVAIFSKLAIKGDTEAQVYYANALYNGIGVEKSTQGLYWFRVAAEAGHPTAIKHMIDRTTSKEKAFWEMMQRDCEKRAHLNKLEQQSFEGNSVASFNLGVYYQGTRDRVNACYWLNIAACQGEPEALSLLNIDISYSKKSS